MASESVLEDITQTAPSITVGGEAMPDAFSTAMTELRVNRGLSTTGRAVLRFIDIGYALSASTTFALGNEVKVSQLKSGVFFSGLVTGTSLETSVNGAPQFVVTVDDKSFKLALTHTIDTYLTMTGSDIVSKLCNAAGLSPNVSGLSGSQYDYLIQKGSDLAFIDTLTRRGDCVWLVTDTTFAVTKAGSSTGDPIKLQYGFDLREFSVRTSGLRPTAVNVRGWDMKQKQAIIGQGTSNPGVTTDATIAAKYGATSPDSALGGSHPITLNQSNPNSQDEATQLATSLNSMWAAHAVTARGTLNSRPDLLPGGTVQIADAGPANGKYIVSEVEHIYSARGYTTKFVAGPLRQTLFVDSFAATQPETGFVNLNLVSALVTEVSGDGDNAGMVKVKFADIGADLESAWARVVSIGGGNSRGGVFLPEVNDEVLVGFERGDTRHPVVLGGLFGGQDPMGTSGVVDSGKVAYRRITSRTGHAIELSDGPEDTKMHVKMTTKTGQVLRLGDDRGDITYASGKPFKIAIGSASIEFDDQGNITIQGAKITVKADMDLSIEGTNVTAKANSTLSLQGTVKSELKGAMVAVEADGQATLKGAMVGIN